MIFVPAIAILALFSAGLLQLLKGPSRDSPMDFVDEPIFARRLRRVIYVMLVAGLAWMAIVAGALLAAGTGILTDGRAVFVICPARGWPCLALSLRYRETNFRIYGNWPAGEFQSFSLPNDCDLSFPTEHEGLSQQWKADYFPGVHLATEEICEGIEGPISAVRRMRSNPFYLYSSYYTDEPTPIGAPAPVYAPHVFCARVSVDHYLLLLPLSVAMVFWLSRASMALKNRRASRLVRNRLMERCNKCGYDLRHSPHRPPECGTRRGANLAPGEVE